MTFQQLIYYALCGMLYLAGLVFGLDYETISIYVCIYFWPALFTAMPAVITLIALYNWCKKLTLWNTINLTASGTTTCAFWLISKEFYHLYTQPNLLHLHLSTIHEQFMACVVDLKAIASQLNMTYIEVNLWIYCVLSIVIALVMWLWFEITIPRKWIINRLWYNHLSLFQFSK